jgi:hypothetical protein
MSERLEARVPAAVRRELDQDPAVQDGFTILVLSTSDDWPHVAMVSRGELICAHDRLLLMALWPSSTACANLTRAEQATLCAVVDGVAYSLRVRARRQEELNTPLAGTLACFALDVESVFGDKAPYAELEGGVRFRLLDAEATVPRWVEVRAELAERAARQ